VVPVSGPLTVFKPPDDFEPEWLVPAGPKFTGGANYVIYNMINGKRYEGETVCFKDRHYNHLRTMKNENAKGHHKHLYRSMRYYGIKNFRFYFRRTFVFEGLEKLNPEDRKAFNKKFKDNCLYPCESYWIRRLGLINKNKGYNKMETGKGGAGHVWTDEQKLMLSAAQIGHMHTPTKPVTRCEILNDGKTHQKVRLTRYESVTAAEKANPGANQANISKCCLNHKGFYSGAGYLWWFCKDTDIYNKDIIVERVGNMPQDYRTAVISKLKLANGDYLEQWHNGMRKAVRTLSTNVKKIRVSKISECCSGNRKSHAGYEFRRVTTEKIEDFDKDGKRIIKSKKRERN